MFAYCLNSPVSAADTSGMRTYFVNGICNSKKKGSPYYAVQFEEEMESRSVDDVVLIPAYNGQEGFAGIARGFAEVACEMANVDIYTNYVLQYILNDLEENPLQEGEKITLVGYSGGGQIVLNVAEKLGDMVDEVILIGSPVLEMFSSDMNVSLLYAGLDPFSWNVGWGYSSYFVGWIGHEDYFNKGNIAKTVSIIAQIIG